MNFLTVYLIISFVITLITLFGLKDHFDNMDTVTRKRFPKHQKLVSIAIIIAYLTNFFTWPIQLILVVVQLLNISNKINKGAEFIDNAFYDIAKDADHIRSEEEKENPS